MRIGIDIDDTIVKTNEFIEKYIKQNPEEFNDSKKLLEDMFYITKGEKISEDVEKIYDELYSNMIKEVELKDNALDILNKLKQEGHDIILITARDNNFFPEGAEKVTKEYLERNNVPYDKLIVAARNKVEHCIENKIDIMIDDSISTCEALQLAGIKCLVYNTKVNENIKTNIPRVYNWLEMIKRIEEETKR